MDIGGRKEMASELIQMGYSERSACEAADLWRSTYQYEPERPDPCEKRMRSRIVDLSRKHRRLGYRKITALVRRWGHQVNPKRVQRVRCLEGLAVPCRRPRKRHLGPIWERPRTARHRNHVWTVDFVFDLTEYGTRLKMLTVVDEYTRECLVIRVERRIDADLLIETIRDLIAERGAPGYIRSDNGPEFIAEKLRRWLAAKGTRAVHIDPGSPWQNGFIESFNGRLRAECLSAELFWSRGEAQVIVEQWRRWYNEGRPHGSLGYRTPAEVGACPAGPSSSPDSAPQGMRSNGVPD